MKRILAAIVATLGLVLGVVVAAPAPAEAASSVYGIHAPRAPGYQAQVVVNLDFMPASWHIEMIDAARIISNASPYVHLVTVASACGLGDPCIAGVVGAANVYDAVYVNPYRLVSGTSHLSNFTGGSSYTRPVYNTNAGACGDNACQKVRSCEMILEALGTKDGCKLDGWPSSDGLAVLNYTHAHTH